MSALCTYRITNGAHVDELNKKVKKIKFPSEGTNWGKCHHLSYIGVQAQTYLLSLARKKDQVFRSSVFIGCLL